MTLKKKILTGYGVAFALMGLVVAWSVMNLVSLGKASEAILSENYRSILAAENMVDALERQDSGILLLFLGDSEKGISQFRENEALFLEWLIRARDNITIQGEAELVGEIDVGYSRYRHQFSSLTELNNSAETVLDMSSYQEKVFPVFDRVRQACISLRNLNEETMYSASVKAGKVARHAIWSTIIVASSALIIALGFSLFLAERIARPIRSFMDASRKISSGDYSVQVSVNTKDELGHLANEFNQMASRLRSYSEMNIEQILSEKNKGEAILSSIEDGLVVFDTMLRVTAINPAARNILGLAGAETSSLQCADLIRDTKVCNLIKNIVDKGFGPIIPDEQKIIVFKEKEHSRQYLFSVTAIRGKDSSLSGIVLLLRDVTRLKEVEKLKSEFVMAASHELRTPLTSLGMSVDLLLEHAAQDLSENDRELLQAAHEEVHRMKALVNDLLDLSKIEGGRIEMEFENVQTSTLFDHVLTLFKNQADMKEVRLTSDIKGKLPKVRADANKITWVLTNLISNALRYVKKGGHIHLAAVIIGQHIHLSVSDDGPGIPQEYHSRIFQKFIQVKGREPGGTGLGLAICKEIVRAHGGTIWVESSPGRGSNFTFTLPSGQ
ncbi:Two component system histidine kinase, HAMP and PAS domains-containing [Desulfonema limicola]|uniref:histidine kinase n=1 Tax=Desulfonema limicola TaxID=45656 RepID=A0A975GH56_9BACT|nr:ATP-binding protein [Desulfonema limicola]QTA81071.1 Two component system histidine kinase, HAMP and PAS domains-containing [Desulfonema limicola]